MRVENLSMRSTKINIGEWAVTLFILVVFIAAYLGAQGWPRNSAFLPFLVSGTGIALVAIKMVAMAIGRDPSAYVAAGGINPRRESKAAESGLGLEKDVEGDGDELEADFAAASTTVWLHVAGWLVGFFVALYAFGLLVTLPIFTILYLRLVARMSYLGTLFYVIGTSGIIYLLFVALLNLPLPEGVLFDVR